MKKHLFLELTGTELAQLVEEGQPVLVDFYGTWCAPCRAMEPVIERLATRFIGRVRVAKINVDGNLGLAAKHQVRGVPCFLLFIGGEPVERVLGMTDEETLAGLIERHCGHCANAEPAPAA